MTTRCSAAPTTRGLMRRIWATARPHRGLMALSLAIFPLAAGLELLQPYLVKLAIDDHILARDWAGLGQIAALFAVSLAALYGLRVAQAYVTQLTGQRVIHDLRATLFAHLQSLDARFFDRNPVGRLMTRVLNDVEAINELFTSGVVSIFGDVLMLTGRRGDHARHELEARARGVRPRAGARGAGPVLPRSVRAEATARCAPGSPGSTPIYKNRSPG